MRLKIDHIEIVYHVSTGIFFPFIFGNMMRTKEKTVLRVWYQNWEKRKLKINNSQKSSATTSCNSTSKDADIDDGR